MRPRKLKFPKTYRMEQALQALQMRVPTDAPITSHWRESFKGAPHMRIAGETGETPWTVDVYNGNFYRVGIGSDGQICHSVPELVGYLCMRLRIAQS